jgi:hypothetical protein
MFTDDAAISPEAKATPRNNPIDTVIKAVITELRAKLPQNVTYIDAFPDKGKDFDMTGYDAAVLVIYGGSNYDGGGSFAASKRSFRLEIMVLSRSLISIDGNTNVSVTSLIEMIRLIVDHGAFGGARNFKVKSDELAGETDTVFTAVLHVEGSMPSLNIDRNM